MNAEEAARVARHRVAEAVVHSGVEGVAQNADAHGIAMVFTGIRHFRH